MIVIFCFSFLFNLTYFFTVALSVSFSAVADSSKFNGFIWLFNVNRIYPVMAAIATVPNAMPSVMYLISTVVDSHIFIL